MSKIGCLLFLFGDVERNQKYAQKLLDTLQTTPRGNEVSSDVEKHPQFHLDARARVVVLKDAHGTELGRLYVGKPDPSYRSTYVRLLDNPRVHFVTADLVPMLSRVTWADRTVWRIPEPEITQIQVSHPQKGVLQTWRRTPGEELTNAHEQALPDGVLSQIAHILASQVLFSSPEAQSEPLYQLDLQVAGVTMILHVFSTSEMKILVQRENSRVFYQMPASFLETIDTLASEAK